MTSPKRELPVVPALLRVEEDSWKNAAASADSDKFSQMNEWTELEQALPILPQAPGLFRIGYCKHPFMHTEVVLICHTTHKRTLAEVITSVSTTSVSSYLSCALDIQSNSDKRNTDKRNIRI